MSRAYSRAAEDAAREGAQRSEADQQTRHHRAVQLVACEAALAGAAKQEEAKRKWPKKKPAYTFCQYINPGLAHEGQRCNCFDYGEQPQRPAA
jgi:hypothetical protein